MIRLRPALAGSIAWLVGATTAVGVGLLALALVGVGPAEEPLQPMSPEAVELEAPVALAPAVSATSAGPVRPTSTPGATTQPSPSGTERLLTSRGGTVVARCRPSGAAYLVYWTPAQGYKAEDVLRGPAAAARLIFEGHEHHYRIVVTCVDGVPRASIRDTEDEREDDD